ncbi:putative chalcone--flavanone isomerase 3 isoform X2 [Apium graveolens]|uniref:putative chalcone--flavanone isomerase 3 isoform X1 n=1 Tax=Apium graveolens TaxID=4045 RepID=UPI003D79D2CD
MGTEVVMVDVIPFPPQITTSSSSSPLSLLAHGITDIEIHFLQVKYTAIGVYLNPQHFLPLLNNWKGKSGDELLQDGDFFDALITARADKVLRIVVIKEIKGSQYGVQVESAVRDRLAEADKYEDEEEAALDQIVEFFQSKYLKKDSVITFNFPATAAIAEIEFWAEGKESSSSKIKVENENVVEMLQKWYLGGSRGVSPTTISSIANSLSTHLCIPSPAP